MSLAVQFLGASDTVTGSRTLVTYQGRSWLIDCGLFQGIKTERQRNWDPFTPAPRTLAGVILTHAHLDHSGYLPRLCQEGFAGPVYASAGTAELCKVLLLDAAHLEEEGVLYANRVGYSDHKPALPLFTTADAQVALEHLVVQPRDHWVPLADGLSFRFIRAGHIIGASFVQLAVETPSGERTLTFSGDLGNGRSLVLRAPETLRDTDALVLESTYGDRLQPRGSVLGELATVANRTFARGGVLVVPAFAVGRAQELLYMLRLLEDRGEIPSVPVILDSPMAAEATRITLRHPEDQVFASAFVGGDEASRPRRLEVTTSADESMLACMREGPMIVISASGMLSGGRILHHLKARLPGARNTVLFSGYQAEGSKGRILQDRPRGLATLRIHHTEVPIEAEIVTLHALSAHADYQDVLDWLAKMDRLPRTILLNHGTPAAQQSLAAKIKARFGVVAIPASTQTTFELGR